MVASKSAQLLHAIATSQHSILEAGGTEEGDADDEGYNTDIGVGGSLLSGGQRQRVAGSKDSFAR